MHFSQVLLTTLATVSAASAMVYGPPAGQQFGRPSAILSHPSAGGRPAASSPFPFQVGPHNGSSVAPFNMTAQGHGNTTTLFNSSAPFPLNATLPHSAPKNTTLSNNRNSTTSHPVGHAALIHGGPFNHMNTTKPSNVTIGQRPSNTTNNGSARPTSGGGFFSSFFGYHSSNSIASTPW